jgi:Fe-S-cluster containining protein
VSHDRHDGHDQKAGRAEALAAHPLVSEHLESLDRYLALLDEDQALRAAEYERPDPARRRLRVACNRCETPFCCNQRVDVELVEALVLYRWAAEHARPQLDEACRRGHELHTRRKPLDIEAFFRRRVPCPFLVKGRCSVYRVRPWSCRTHYMASAPLKCRDELQPKETYAMDPDPTIRAELRQLADDVKFFARIEGVEPVELAEVLHLVDRVVRGGVTWAKTARLDWALVDE